MRSENTEINKCSIRVAFLRARIAISVPKNNFFFFFFFTAGENCFLSLSVFVTNNIRIATLRVLCRVIYEFSKSAVIARPKRILLATELAGSLPSSAFLFVRPEVFHPLSAFSQRIAAAARATGNPLVVFASILSSNFEEIRYCIFS